MNVPVLIAAVFSLFSYSSQPPRAQLPASPAPLAGDYVEARTESVFAGPCHVNGEVMTTGRDAVMAWQFNSGVRVMAVISSEANLADQSASRKSEIVIDSSAGQIQSDAALAAILEHEKSALGRIVSVRHGIVTFHHVDREYQVESPGFAAIDVQGMPNDECCKQPNLVWFSPMSHLVSRKVGYTVNAEYSAGTLADSWQRGDENGAFYGPFAY
jgi:hypothetical protein